MYSAVTIFSKGLFMMSPAKSRFISTALLCGAIMFQAPWSTIAQPVQSYAKQADGVVFTLSAGKLRIKACAVNIVRVTWTPAAAFSTRASLMVADTFPTPPTWNLDSTATAVTLSAAAMKAEVTKATGAIRFLDAAGAVLISENADTGRTAAVATVDTSGYSVKMAFNLTTEEGVYGGGHFDNDNTFNRNTAGHSIRMLVANRDKPIPFIISTKGWGLLWDNYSDTYFRFLGAANRTLTLTSEVADQIDYYIVAGQQLDEIIAGYRTITGAAPLFPKYAYGFWHSRERYVSQEEVQTMASEFRTRNIPIDVIVQDWRWWQLTSADVFQDGTWNCMIWDATRFPNPTQLCSFLHNMNMRLSISVWPTLGSQSAIYNDFKIRGWVFNSLYEYGNAYVYDAFRPEAGDLLWQYMNTGVSPTTGIWNKGVDVWWFDGSEPECGPLGSGEKQADLKTSLVAQGDNYLGSFYRYATGYSLVHSGNVYRNQRATSPEKRVCVLTRSTQAGSQRYGAVSWGGDCQSNAAQMAREITWAINYCAAGVPYWTTDPGAFYAYPPGQPEPSDAAFRALYTRWFQFVCFLPIFRSHGSGANHREMWYFAPYTDSTYQSQLKFDQLRYRLLPYIYSLAWKVTNEGYTIIRALPFDFKNDNATYTIGDQYMFGPAFLVNPFMTIGSNSRKVYLPAGMAWYDFWNGAVTAGGQTVTAAATITSMPLYVRAGSIIPMGPVMTWCAEKPLDTVELRIYPGADGQFTLYEDEGEGYGYETGAYTTIPITYTDNPRRVTIGGRSGSFTGMTQKKVFNIVYVGAGRGTSVIVTPDPDCVLEYSGSEISGVIGRSSTTKLRSYGLSMKTIHQRFALGKDFTGRLKSIAVYDLQGNLLHKQVTRDNIVDIGRFKKMSSEVRIVKVKTLDFN